MVRSSDTPPRASVRKRSATPNRSAAPKATGSPKAIGSPSKAKVRASRTRSRSPAKSPRGTSAKRPASPAPKSQTKVEPAPPHAAAPWALFAALSMAGLVSTWYYNILFMCGGPWQVHLRPLDLFDSFLDWLWVALRGNFVTTAITTEILMLVLVFGLFCYVESVRSGITRPAAYILGGYMVAIAFTAPLFVHRWLSRDTRPAPKATKVTDLSTEVTILAAYLAVSAVGFSYAVSCPKGPFGNALLFTYFAVPQATFIALSAITSHAPQHNKQMVIDDRSSRRVETVAKIWTVLSLIVAFSGRLRALSVGGVLEMVAAFLAPSWSITYDYAVVSAAIVLMIAYDPAPTKHKWTYAIATAFVPPAGLAAFVAQKEMDRRGEGATRCALVDIGYLLCKLCVGAILGEMIAFKLFDNKDLEVQISGSGFGIVEYFRSEHQSAFNVSKYVMGRGGTLAGAGHILCGLCFMILCPLQFDAAFRKANLATHRWVGRFVMLCSLLTTYSLYEMITNPKTYLFDPSSCEIVPTAVFTVHFFVSGALSFWYAWKRDIPTHRRWVIRHFANATAVGAYRFITLASSLLVVRVGDGLNADKNRSFFGIGIWLLWPTSLFFGEVMVWYRYWEPGFGK